MNRRAFFGRLAALIAVGPLAKLAPKPQLMFHRDAFRILMRELDVIQPRDLVGVDLVWSQPQVRGLHIGKPIRFTVRG